MSLKHVAAFAAAIAVLSPTVSPAFATGSRIDRSEMKERRAKLKQEEKAVWAYAVGTSQVGPMTKDQLIAAAKAGTVKADTQVYSPEAGWRPAAQVPELESALN